MFSQRIKMGLATTLIFFSAVAYAHRFHAGITDISMNPTSGNTEIVHTYMAHDIEALLVNLYQRQFDLSDVDDQVLIRKYIEKNFQVFDHKQTALPLKWVGMKVDVNSVIVFQEIEKMTVSSGTQIRQAVLSDFLAEQVNTININTKSGIQTLSFTRSNREQAIP